MFEIFCEDLISFSYSPIQIRVKQEGKTKAIETIKDQCN